MTTFELDPDSHHYLGIEMNQQVWQLLGQGERSAQDDRRMEQFALASFHHWTKSPKFKPINAQRAHWILARVYAVLHRSEDALRHAENCSALTREHDLKDFDLAYAHEAMARALATAKRGEDAAYYFQEARIAAEKINGEENQQIFLQDLQGPPWFGFEF